VTAVWWRARARARGRRSAPGEAWDDDRVPTTTLPPYAAYLRVYEPLAAFGPDERAEWEKFLARQYVPQPPSAGVDAGTPVGGLDLAEEHRRVRAQVVALPPIVVPSHEERVAYVLTVDHAPLLCPWQLRLRSWLALKQLRRELDPPLLAACLPPAVLARIDAERESWGAGDADENPHILTTTWQLPTGWFMIFSDEERMVRDDVSERSLVYRTPMAQARRRLALALRTLRRAAVDGPLIVGVETLGRWLEEFHPRSYVELDYGGLAQLRTPVELATDRSVADVQAGLAALNAGDEAGAVTAHRRLLDRWRSIQAYEQAN
jgi:hypothetical protein